MYKVECTKCGKRINIQLCSKCYNPETLNEELGKQLPEGLKKKYDEVSANAKTTEQS